MGEYVQLTIDDYFRMKQSLGEELKGVSRSFVRIGYKLRKIADSGQYLQDGYKTVTEFAEKEYGLTKSVVSRFIAINKKYSVDGYSETLLPQYEGMEQSKLSEMLSLPDSDLPMIQPEMQRSDIRALKQFNNTEPVNMDADLHDLIVEFFRSRREILDSLFSEMPETDEDIAEIVCPSGAQSFRHGKFFMMMYENKICIKEYGKDFSEFGWNDFFGTVQQIFGEHGEYIKDYFGNHEEISEENASEIAPENAPEPAENKEKVTVAPAQQEDPEEAETEEEEDSEQEASQEEKESEDDQRADEEHGYTQEAKDSVGTGCEGVQEGSAGDSEIQDEGKTKLIPSEKEVIQAAQILKDWLEASENRDLEYTKHRDGTVSLTIWNENTETIYNS